MKINIVLKVITTSLYGPKVGGEQSPVSGGEQEDEVDHRSLGVRVLPCPVDVPPDRRT